MDSSNKIEEVSNAVDPKLRTKKILLFTFFCLGFLAYILFVTYILFIE